jgi:hypothetical protein
MAGEEQFLFVRCNRSVGERIPFVEANNVRTLRELVCPFLGLSPLNDLRDVELLAQVNGQTVLLSDYTNLSTLKSQAAGAGDPGHTTICAARVSIYHEVAARAWFFVRWWQRVRFWWHSDERLCNIWIILVLTFFGLIPTCVVLGYFATAHSTTNTVLVVFSQAALAVLGLWASIVQHELREAIRRIHRFGPLFLLPRTD